jgi:hypothetical protein
MEHADRSLMLAAARGDAESFGLLFDRHQQRLFAGLRYRIHLDTLGERA